MPELVDTHCHIHEVGAEGGDQSVSSVWQKGGISDADALIAEAVGSGVKRIICVGTSVEDSQLAVDFVKNRPNCWASVGIHPHESKQYRGKVAKLDKFKELASSQKVVAIGECGLDYYYRNSPKDAQAEIFRFQLDLALAHDLPLIFHVREAFSDFFRIVDNYKSAGQRIRGVVHSFSSTTRDLEEILAHGFYVGLNGIMTFTKNSQQTEAAKAVPLNKLLLETDAPFLTPVPYRGTICQPKHVRATAEYLSDLRGETLEELTAASTASAKELFNLI